MNLLFTKLTQEEILDKYYIIRFFVKNRGFDAKYNVPLFNIQNPENEELLGRLDILELTLRRNSITRNNWIIEVLDSSEAQFIFPLTLQKNQVTNGDYICYFIANEFFIGKLKETVNLE